MNPLGQVQLPEAEQVPAPAHGGEHAADCISRREKAPAEDVVGSCEMSGMESQRMSLELVDPEVTAAQVFDAIARESAESGVDVFEPLDVVSGMKAG